MEYKLFIFGSMSPRYYFRLFLISLSCTGWLSRGLEEGLQVVWFSAKVLTPEPTGWESIGPL